MATFERRLNGHPDFELQECLRNIHRIVEIRLNDKTNCHPLQGQQVWDWQEDLAQYSDPGFKEAGQLTVTYLTEAHLACSQSIQNTMKQAGFDEVYVDAVGNVVGRYHPSVPGAKYLMTGSHFDTVRNGGKYDGRLGIFVPIACVQKLAKAKQRLPIGLEVVAFAEEEGQRYKATFLGSGALVGQFNPDWLTQTDANGISMREAMKKAGLNEHEIANIQRKPADYVGFVEVHIEQGPVLNELNLPLGVICARWWAWPVTQAPRPWTAGEMLLARWPSWPSTWKNARQPMAILWPPLANSKSLMVRSMWSLANARSPWTCAPP
jgi:N-carbamoyl-L-amino-acid hydrolase